MRGGIAAELSTEVQPLVQGVDSVSANHYSGVGLTTAGFESDGVDSGRRCTFVHGRRESAVQRV